MTKSSQSLYLKDTTQLLKVSDVSSESGASAYYINQEDSKQLSIVIHKSADGQMVAFSAVCPHAKCIVDIAPERFHCPCHGSEFDLQSGELRHGPATVGLTPLTIHVAGDLIEIEL